MAEVKNQFLMQLKQRFGRIRKLQGSESLYALENSNVRIYIRYSKVHQERDRTFYGLREQDLRQLQGLPSFVAFLWSNQQVPLLIPFAEYEEVFHATKPAPDGQYKVQIILRAEATEMYIAGAGRFNVECYFGWNRLQSRVNSSQLDNVPELNHSQVQTLLGSIGFSKGYDIWVPANDRERLDFSLGTLFECRMSLPSGFDEVRNILQEVDVIWIRRGSSDLLALFEVEHSTPVYSGLLRWNDIHLVAPRLRPSFSIVANDTRRELFVRQLRRPTFRLSGLSELCNFLEYHDVFGWYHRVTQERGNPK